MADLNAANARMIGNALLGSAVIFGALAAAVGTRVLDFGAEPLLIAGALGVVAAADLAMGFWFLAKA